MEFALLNAVRNLPEAAYSLADVYADYISDAVLAEELGFTHSWYGEHHFRPCQWTGSPMMVATAVAARTSRIRVGSAVALLPFHDPRRVAEDAAIADILSNGRFDLGVGPEANLDIVREALAQWLGPEGQDNRQEQVRDGMALVDGMAAARIAQELWRIAECPH